MPSIRSKVLSLLKEKDMTSLELLKEIIFPEVSDREFQLLRDNNDELFNKKLMLIQVYLRNFKNARTIDKIGSKDNFFIYRAIRDKTESIDNSKSNKLKKGFNMYHSLFKELTKTEITKEKLMSLAKKHLDITLLKELEETI